MSEDLEDSGLEQQPGQDSAEVQETITRVTGMYRDTSL